MIAPSSSVAFSIGGFDVAYYSITMFLAIISATFFSVGLAKKYYPEIDKERIYDLLPWIVLFGIIGARIYYVIADWQYYSEHLNEILAIRQGGLSIHGALLGGILGGYVYVKKHSLNFLKYLDVFSYGIILGQIIGRFGNYFNIEAFGKPCYFSKIICMYVPEVKRPFQYLDVNYFHPTFLYEMIWNLIVLLILFFVIRRIAKKADGVLFFSYLGLYSIGRFLIEGIRVDSVKNIGEVPLAAFVSFLLLCLSIIVCFFLQKIKNK